MLHENRIFKEINHYPLPCLNYKYAPQAPGVYFICVDEFPVYIGSSKWLKARLNSHAKVLMLKKKNIHYKIYVIPYDKYHYLEGYLVKHFLPVYNKYLFKNVQHG